MNCINFDRCAGEVDLASNKTYWQAECFIRSRDGGGPNRRRLEMTGRGLCPECSMRIEYGLEVEMQESLL